MRYLAAAAVSALLCLVTAASAHGPAEWIQDGGIRNAVGELCCGERDCGMFAGGKIVPMADGWHVDAIFRGSYSQWKGNDQVLETFEHEVHEVVPYSQAQPSPDG